MLLTLLTLIPLVALLICLMVLKLSVPKSGAISLGLAVALAFVFFGFTPLGFAVAIGKALWLALFVALIVWAALLLYHLVSDFGAITVVNASIERVLKDKFVAFVLLAWVFTGMLQGIAGFGVPSVIVAPILIALGFSPLKSVAAALMGHSWAVTFGSMGAAYFVIQNLTGIPPEHLRYPLWIFCTVNIFLAGIGVCWIGFGAKGIVKGLAYVIPVATLMSMVQLMLVSNEMFHLATILTAAAGLVWFFGLYKIREFSGRKSPISEEAAEATEPTEKPKHKLSLVQSTAPYALILVLLLSFQAIPVEIREAVALAPSFPATATSFTDEESSVVPFTVPEARNYSPIRLFVHPVFVLLIASGTACLIYKKAGIWDAGKFRNAAKLTVKKGIPATLALVSLGSMSLIMMDSGMTFRLARAIGDLTGDFFPFISPFLGVLASFLTGNNTNANVLFGALQYNIAQELNVSTAMMAASQTMSAGLGVAIGPTLVLMAALATKQEENVPALLKKLIPLVLIIAAAMGIVNYVLIENPWLMCQIYGCEDCGHYVLY
ncbi:MAG: L-lactate permease [Oscillospiraceae bacterium]|nr:L-lactate permease [Oscillospiraceae bacterium]